MTIITSKITTLGRLRRQSPRKTAKQTFRGVIAPSLGVLIRDPMQEQSTGSFSPVDKEFYKPDNTLEFPALSQAHPQSNNSYTFAPTIELSCFLQPFIQKLFASQHAHKFQTLTKQTNDWSSTSRSVVASVNHDVTQEFRRETTLKRETSTVLNLIRQAATRQRQGDSPTLLTQQHMSVQLNRGTNNAARDAEPAYLTTIHPNFAFHRSGLNPVTNLFWSTAIANIRMEPQRFYRSSDSSFLIQRKLSTSNSENNSAFFSTVSLNFAVPNSSDVESINQRIAHFVSSPALTYVKAQQSANETLIQTLRELRTQPTQQRPPAVMQMPTIEQLTNQVKTQIERDIRIERERRGL